MKKLLFIYVFIVSFFFCNGQKLMTPLSFRTINCAEDHIVSRLVLNNRQSYLENRRYDLYVNSENIDKISSLSFDIFYEKDVVSVYSSYNYLTIDSSSMFDDRIDNENGVIHVSYIFAENKKLDDGSLFNLSFSILNTTKANSYFSLAITSSLDQDTNQIDMKGDFDYFAIKDINYKY